MSIGSRALLEVDGFARLLGSHSAHRWAEVLDFFTFLADWTKGEWLLVKSHALAKLPRSGDVLLGASWENKRMLSYGKPNCSTND